MILVQNAKWTMTLMTKMMMMMMLHVYRKYVVFNIYIYTWFEGYYIFLKCYLGFFVTQSTLKTWCNKKEAGHILAIYIYPLSISSVIIMISICSRYGMYFIDYMINLYISFFFCINSFYMWLPLFSLFIILCHISVLCIVFLGGGGWWGLYLGWCFLMISCNALSLVHEITMQCEEVTDKRC